MHYRCDFSRSHQMGLSGALSALHACNYSNFAPGRDEEVGFGRGGPERDNASDFMVYKASGRGSAF